MDVLNAVAEGIAGDLKARHPGWHVRVRPRTCDSAEQSGSSYVVISKPGREVIVVHCWPDDIEVYDYHADADPQTFSYEDPADLDRLDRHIEGLMEARSRERLDLLRRARGLWKDRGDVPSYAQLRAEWDRGEDQER